MIASPAKGRSAARDFLVPFLMASALLAGGSAAMAQTTSTEAVPTEPSVSSEPLAPPTPLLPFDPTPRQPQGVDPTADAPSVQGIEINPLSEIDPDSLGLLEPAEGGFGKTVVELG